jgi:hypothetical protein
MKAEQREEKNLKRLCTTSIIFMPDNKRKAEISILYKGKGNSKKLNRDKKMFFVTKFARLKSLNLLFFLRDVAN